MKKAKGLWRTLLFFSLLAALCGSFALPVVNARVSAAPQLVPSATVVISQIYGGGGNSGAPYTNDFIELFNLGASPVSLSGWSVQYAGTTSTSWAITNLSGSLAPGKYYLVQLAGGANGSALPTPDATGTTAMAAAAGKVALVNNITALVCGSSNDCLPNSNIIDFVGYGSTASSYEGSGPAPAPSNANADIRNGNGCADTDNNNSDFTAVIPSPRNSSSLLALCMDPLTVTAVANLTGTAAAITSTASAVNATGTAAAVTGTASAVNATNTSSALTGTATNTPTNTGTPTSTSTGSATNVVISEFRTTGPNGASDEFVEIYNPTSNWVDISGWQISASNNDGSSVQTRATIPAATILRSGQYYLVANNSYSNTTVTADLKYGTSITDDGGIALLKSDGTTIADEVGMSAGSAYQEGKTLSKLTDANRTYERRDGGNSDSCKDTNDNFSDFINQSSPSPHNYSTIRLCGGSSVSLISTTTQITSDSPDPSLVNANVSVSVKVTGSSLSPNGTKVNITGANTNCQITLNSSGTGSCNVKFTSTGFKTLTATYFGDNTHAKSTGTTSHQVSTSGTVFKTPTPIPLPPPQLVAINEFVPRPGHDWNHDGVVNVGDEFIELLNHGVVDVNLSGYSLDDEVNVGSEPYRLPAKVLKPGERVVFYGSETGLLLGDGGDGVRLLKPNGQLADAYNYTIARYPDESYCRLPDNGGADDWNQYCYPTPGLQNSASGNFAPPSNGISAEPSCPISDTLPDPFVQAECDPFGNNIWRPDFWDQTGWYDEKNLPLSDGKWPVFAD